MIKKLKIALVVVVLLVAAWFIADLMLSKSYITPEFSDRDKIFMTGSIDDVKDFLDHSERGVHLTNFYSLIRRDRNDILKMVIEDYGYRADLNAKDLDLATPLYFASQEFKPESVKLLIEYGADVNFQDPHGMTALIAASDITHEHQKTKSQEITKLLIEAEADINIVAKFGETAIKGSVLSKDLERTSYLINSGGNAFQLDSDKSNYMFYCFTIKCYEYFISIGIDINETNADGTSILQTSQYVSNKDLNIIEKLLEFGADICHKDNTGATVLNYVERQGTGPHLHKEKPEVYKRSIEKNRASEVYQFLNQKYQEDCL